MGGQKECLPGPFFRNPFHLIKNSTRPDDGHPVFRGTLSFSHPGFCRFFSNRLVREDADPDPAGPLDKSGHSNSCGLNLAGSQPTTFYGLKSEVTKVETVSTGGNPSSLSLLLLSVFCFLRHQHNVNPVSPSKSEIRISKLLLTKQLFLLLLLSGRPLP
jgi:hypothetical protein